MNIPRKRAGLPLLKQGLSEFGIRGPFTTKLVTHDELDAITSAIVGLFFFAGRFESLGKEDEEALIIPDLRVDPTIWRSRKVIGFSGALASGKTTAAKYLGGLGFAYGRYSQVLADQLQKNGNTPTRKELQEYGLYVNRELGQRWLGRQLLRLLDGNTCIAIDGMRFPEDHALLVEKFGPQFLHVHLEATIRKRRERFKARDGADKVFSEADGHLVENGVHYMMSLASIRIGNDAGLQEFLKKIKRLVED
jgi:dephospho-CoA kinase